MKLERYVVVGKTICSWKDPPGCKVRVVETYFIDKIFVGLGIVMRIRARD